MTNNTDKTMIQIQDEPDGDAITVHLIASNNNLQAPILSFVVSRTTEATYFGQLNSPAMWLNRTAQKRFDPAAIESLHRIERNEMNNSAFFRLSQYHRAALLVEQREGVLSAPMTRPPSGSRWQIALAAEISEFMQLPPTGYSIGHIAGIKTREGGNIEMRLTSEILFHHILSAGQTGSGKSNTNANIIGAAQAAGFCSLVYDMKPDYSEIDRPNDEPLPPDVVAEGFRNVTYWTLGSDQVRPNETAISVPACELDPSKLAQVIFYRPGEDNQQEVCEQLLTGYAINQEEAGNEFWTMQDFITWLSNASLNPVTAAQAMPFPATFNTQTFNAVRSKVNRPGRIPSWIDGHMRGSRIPLGGILGGLGQPRPDQNALRLFNQLCPGAIHVIRVRAEGDGRSYALFLDYAMRKVANLRRDEPETTPPILHLLDEAPDLFKTANRRLGLATEGTVDEQVRKGRSLSIGFVLSSQSAGDIPERIRHNLNSIIVFKHRQPKILTEILPEMTAETRQLASRLQRGEALVELFQTSGLSRCKMRQSPARLFKPSRRAPVEPTTTVATPRRQKQLVT